MTDNRKELIVRLPTKVYDTLAWYVRETHHWVMNDREKESMGELAAIAIEDYLKGQAAEPVDAIDKIKYELKQQLELE